MKDTIMTPGIAGKVETFCQKNGLFTFNDTVVIGVSGGPDSLCLLDILVSLQQKYKLRLIVAHLNHQLRNTDSDIDARFVEEIAAKWQLSFYLESQNVSLLATQRKQSLEEAARQARYAFLWQAANKTGASKIAVGHNANDQVETVLMHFLRGTGLAGLQGMLPATDISGLRLSPEDIPNRTNQPAPQIIRPLLEISRQEIENYCKENNLSPQQDYSNQDTTFFRNRLRHKLIPILQSYNPNINQVLQRTASVIAAEKQFLDKEITKVWATVVVNETPKAIEFDLKQWLNLPLAMKRSTLRKAVYTLRRSLRDLGFEHVENAIEIVETGKTGSQAILPKGLVLTVGYSSFVITPEDETYKFTNADMPQLHKGQVEQIKIPGTTTLSATNWQLVAQLRKDVTFNTAKQADNLEAYLDADMVGTHPILRTRQPGDTFCPLGMNGQRKKINDFMINEKIPANQRNLIPLLVAHNKILWVCGYRPDERAKLCSDTKRVLYLKFECIQN